MKNLIWFGKVSIVFVVCAMAIGARAQTFSTLVVFDQTNGGSPSGRLVQGLDGNFYGTTAYGGNKNCGWAGGCGTAFKITSSGALTTLYEFCSEPQCSDGVFPVAGLVLTNSGVFYGITAGDGSHSEGTVFKLTQQGVLTTLYSFCSQPNCADGDGPGTLMQSVEGDFYGTTFEFGAYGYGTVFKITPGGVLTSLHSFNGRDGGYPKGGLIQGTTSRLYGTTSAGGSSGDGGTIYEISPTGNLATVFRFCSANCPEGSMLTGALVEGTDVALYGTTVLGGYGDGTVFKIAQSGSLTSLYSFCQHAECPDGAAPSGLVLSTDGTFYGITLNGGSGSGCLSGCGTIFNISSDGVLNTLHDFDGVDDGYETFYGGALLQATSGKFYGMTNAGGSSLECSGYYTGCGTVFTLDNGLSPFVTFVRAAGRVGQAGGILGQGFTGTTSVSLNGIPASFTVVSDTFIRATVPAGATTGYVTVTTPSGTLTSNAPFHVIR